MKLAIIVSLSAFFAGICCAQTPTITRIQNGATFDSTVASRSWVTIRGTNLSLTTRIWGAGDFQAGRLPRSLDAVSVKINGRDAAVYFVSPTQLNVLSPSDDALGFVLVEVAGPFGSASQNVFMERYSPGFFAFTPENSRYAAAVFPDGTYAGKPNLFSGLPLRTVHPGDRLILFGTGFGDTDPSVPTDVAFFGAAPLASPVRIELRGVEATVEFAGLISVGLYQFNIIVPEVPDGDQVLRATIEGITSPPVYVTIGEVAQPDLVVSALTSATSARAGGQIPIDVTVTNQGNLPVIEQTAMRLYYSFDERITNLDIYSGYGCTIRGIGVNGRDRCVGNITVLSNLPAGTWYLGAIADDDQQVIESDEDNNGAAADTGPLSVTGAISLSPPEPLRRLTATTPPEGAAAVGPMPPPKVRSLPSGGEGGAGPNSQGSGTGPKRER